MARVTGPLFSRDATGSTAAPMSYVHQLGRTRVERKPRNKRPTTIDGNRNVVMLEALAAAWPRLTALQQATWSTYPEPKPPSTYHAFIRENLRRLGANLPATRVYPPEISPPTVAASTGSIIQYGRDVHIYAVSITMLNAWLSCIIDVTTTTPGPPDQRLIVASTHKPHLVITGWTIRAPAPGIHHYRWRTWRSTNFQVTKNTDLVINVLPIP